MAVSRSLRRTLEVRALEEELSQAALEEALSSLRLLEGALQAARERERSGRRHVTASAASADAADRIAGLEETRAASRRAAALKPRIAEMEDVVAARRAEFLEKRMERRQVETLIRKTEAADAVVAGRRTQREIDDWFLRGAGHADGAVEEG
jgi:flagellar biosynthesis chaperone FliJ